MSEPEKGSGEALYAVCAQQTIMNAFKLIGEARRAAQSGSHSRWEQVLIRQQAIRDLETALRSCRRGIQVVKGERFDAGE